MGRSPCCSKEGLNRGAWTAAEDKILREYIKVHGEGSWRNLPKRAGLKRCGKSCRLRWLNYLRPDIKRGNITQDEEELIIRLHKLLGNRWSLIAGRLPGRTDNEIKNYWNTNLGKRSVSAKSSAQGSSVRVEKKCSFLGNSTVQLAKYDMISAANVVPPTIRTKASRCTKVMVVPPQKFGEEMICTSASTSEQPLALEEEEDDNNKEGPAAGHPERSEMDALIFEHDINPQEGSNFSTSLDLDDINDDFGLSDLLDFNFSSPPSTLPPLIFDQETGVLAGNWNTGNCSCCMELHDSASDETQTSLDALIIP